MTPMAPALREAIGGITEENRRFMESFNSGDIAGAAREAYAKGARILPPDGRAVAGRDNIVRFWMDAAEDLGVRGVRLATVELHTMGDQAYEIGQADLYVADGSMVEGKYVVIWKREDGGWRRDVDIWNLSD
jgi:ketosteroid isomerase-like protein